MESKSKNKFVRFFVNLFTKNIALKIVSLFLALYVFIVINL